MTLSLAQNRLNLQSCVAIFFDVYVSTTLLIGYHFHFPPKTSFGVSYKAPQVSSPRKNVVHLDRGVRPHFS